MGDLRADLHLNVFMLRSQLLHVLIELGGAAGQTARAAADQHPALFLLGLSLAFRPDLLELEPVFNSDHRSAPPLPWPEVP